MRSSAHISEVWDKKHIRRIYAIAPGLIDIYYGEDREVWADFDGDGRCRLAGAEGSSDMD